MSIPILPGADSAPAERAARLAKKREDYRWSYTYLPPLAMSEVVPEGEQPALRWILSVVDRALHILENNYAIARDDKTAQGHFALGRELLRARRNFDRAGLHDLLAAIAFALIEGGETRRAKSLDDYAALFHAIALPPEVAAWRDDRFFARMRVAGPNPLIIARLQAPDPRFPVGEAHYPGLARAFAEGRLFLADYRALADLLPGSFPDGPKFVSPALAMFVVEAGALLPIAIQCAQTAGAPILTPRDGERWQIAKSIVSVADGILHETVSHLGRTHLLLEPIVVATHRQLDERHPLSVLLLPHFEGTLFINNAAHTILLADRGPVDALLAGTAESTRQFATRASALPSFDDSSPRALFRRRGVDDATILPDYPYRDDALLLWDAIHLWVTDYLALYYAGDDAVRADPELQAWIAELCDGGRLDGIGEKSSEGRPAILTLGYLIEAVTLILFTASAQHAAVNSPQHPLMTYAPNAPLAGYAPPTDENLLAHLPPLDTAQTGLNVTYVLGSVRYTQLGDYGLFHFTDRRAHGPLRRFQDRLKEIEATIVERNRHRAPYPYLLPSAITQSINI